MKIRLFFLLLLLPLPAFGQVTYRCPELALNIHAYELAIREQVLAMIDPDTYVLPTVRVRLVPVNADRKVKTTTVTDFLNGAIMQLNGLSATASGSLSFAPLCRHTYRARITIMANDYTSGTRLRTSTDSLIVINSSGEYEFGKIKLSGNPVPGTTPTVAATPATAK